MINHILLSFLLCMFLLSCNEQVDNTTNQTNESINNFATNYLSNDQSEADTLLALTIGKLLNDSLNPVSVDYYTVFWTTDSLKMFYAEINIGSSTEQILIEYFDVLNPTTPSSLVNNDHLYNGWKCESDILPPYCNDCKFERWACKMYCRCKIPGYCQVTQTGFTFSNDAHSLGMSRLENLTVCNFSPSCQIVEISACQECE